MKYEKPIMNISIFKAENISTTGLEGTGTAAGSLPPSNFDNALTTANNSILSNNTAQKALVIIKFNE